MLSILYLKCLEPKVIQVFWIWEYLLYMQHLWDEIPKSKQEIHFFHIYLKVICFKTMYLFKRDGWRE